MHYLHTASRRIIELLVAERIGTLVLGKNRTMLDMSVRDLFTYSLCMAGVREGRFLSGRQTGERGAAEAECGVGKNRASISIDL